MEMEKEEVKLEQEEQETSLIVRKSRINGHAILSNGAENEELETSGEAQKFEELEVLENGSEAINGELKTEATNGEHKELDGVLENEAESINGEHKIEEINGVLENEAEPINGEHKIEEMNGVLENEAEPINGEHKIEEMNGVLETEPEVQKGEQKPDNLLVYYDKIEGVEGTGHKDFDVSSLDFVVQNSSTSVINNGYNRDHDQNSFQERSKSYEPSKEIESAEVDLINEDDLEAPELDDDLEAPELDVEGVLQKQTTHDLFCPNCNSCITGRVILRKRKRRIRISDEEVKRNKTKAAVDPKLGAVSAQSSRDEANYTDEVDDNDAQIPAVDEDERDKGPDIFRCLSCFSFFTPTGNGFKLFRIFGEKSRKENVRNEQAPSIKKNLFTSMFASNKQETAVEQGSSIQTDVPRGDVGVVPSTIGDQSGESLLLQRAPSPAHASDELAAIAGKYDILEDGDKISPFPKRKPYINGKVIVGTGDKLDTTAAETADAIMEQFDAYTKDQLKESKTSKEVHVDRESDLSVATLPISTQVAFGESAEEPVSFSQNGGLKLLIFSNKESPTLHNSEEGLIPNQTMQSGDKETIQLQSTSVSILKTSDVKGRWNIAPSIPHEEQDVKATIQTESVLEHKKGNFRGSNDGHLYPTEISQHLISETKIEVHSSESLEVNNISGKHTVITIDAQPAGSSQAVQDTIHPTETTNLLQSATQISIAGSRRTEAREETKIEVIKSIVYGGLAESITSLSVVSSAAGGGAGTVNVLALGMANLIGGLFIICHNIWELKSNRIELVANQISESVTEQHDRYKQLLGRRQNFILHTVVATMSYLIFGLVPLVVYGFSFRKTNDKQLKLVVMAAASLLCILMLAIGRAYVRRPPKPYLKSVISFVILGLTVSGVSYAAGVLVERLLEKLGLFEPGSVLDLFVPDMRSTSGSGWASY